MRKKTTDWLEISVSVPPRWGELVAGRMFELGAGAVEERREKDRCVMITHYPFDDGVNAKAASLGRFLAGVDELAGDRPEVRVRKVEGRDWAQIARRSIKPLRIAGNLWVAPSWTPKEELPEGDTLVIDPGEAFGAGSHPTTRLAAELLLDTIKEFEKPGVLDVGAGTGILAMAAQRAGAAPVVAVDNDPKAIETASANFRQNHCVIEMTGRDLGRISGSFDIIVANILLDTLLDMAPHFKRLAAPGGFVILSGLLLQQRDDMRAAMEKAGFGPPDMERATGEWLAMRHGAP